MKFGHLTVLKKTTQKLRREYLYDCLCDCGKTTLATSQALKSGHKKSCGHTKTAHFTYERAMNAHKIVNGVDLSVHTDKLSKANKSGIRGISQDEYGYVSKLIINGKTYRKRSQTLTDAKKILEDFKKNL